jgi:hypothetical protein
VRIQGRVPRISCLVALGLRHPCDQILSLLHSKNLFPLPSTVSAPELSRPSSSSRHSRSGSVDSSTTLQKPAPPKKRKVNPMSKTAKKDTKTDYPADCALSAENEKRSKFAACDHTGPCTRGCPCVEGQVHCEKSCACAPVPASTVYWLT